MSDLSVSAMLASTTKCTREFWEASINQLRASGRIQTPFWDQPDWPIERDTIASRIKQYAKSDLFVRESERFTRVFYLRQYFAAAAAAKDRVCGLGAPASATRTASDWIRRLLTRTPFIYVGAGELQDGTRFGSRTSETLARGVRRYGLVSHEERILARRKVVCTPVHVLARGGYPKPSNAKVTVLERRKRCLMLSVLGPQMDESALDAKYFVKRDRNGEHFFDDRLYLRSITHDVFLWLYAFDAMVRIQGDGRKGLLHMCRVGCGFFAEIRAMGVNVGDRVAACMVEAVRRVLRVRKFEHIAAIDLVRFDVADWFAGNATIVRGGVEIRANVKDALDFDDDDYAKYHIGVTNASDSWSAIGNEMGYDSLEAMLGNNTTLRVNQVYHWNPHLLDRRKYVGVDLPSEIGSSVYACCGSERVGVDASSAT